MMSYRNLQYRIVHDAFQNHFRNADMRFHNLHFLVGQPARGFQYIQRNRNFAEVVQKRPIIQVAQVFPGKPHQPPDLLPEIDGRQRMYNGMFASKINGIDKHFQKTLLVLL